jgi:hypothetical protein
MTEYDIVAEIERDLQEGVDGTGIRAGFIGEIGVSAHGTLASFATFNSILFVLPPSAIPLTSVQIPFQPSVEYAWTFTSK